MSAPSWALPCCWLPRGDSSCRALPCWWLFPFVVSALLVDRLKGAFDFIKRHYRVINLVSGLVLVIVGILMATGYMGYWLSLLSF